MACAIAVELGDCGVLVHGNHLAYGWLGLGFYRLWQALGYGGPAMLVLQSFSSLLGAVGVGAFAALALRAGAGRAAAAAASAALAASQAWWFWSLESQVYMLGAACIALAAREAVSDSPRPAALGLWHAGAMLGHVAHAMFAPAALWWLLSAVDRERRARAVLVYGASAGAALLLAYAAAALLCVQPADFRQAKLWLLGSAAITVDRTFEWHGSYSWQALGHWARMSLRIFADPLAASGTTAAAGWMLAGAGLAGALGAAALLWRSRRRLVGGCLLWLSGYALLFVSWEPWTVVYRITDLLPLWLLAAAGATAQNARAGAAALAVWALAALLFNHATVVGPRTDPRRNPEYMAARWLGEATPQESWVVVNGVGQVYVPYFAHRKPLNLRFYAGQEERLFERLDAIAASGRPVFVTDKTLDDAWRPVFERYGIEEAGHSEWGELFRVKRQPVRRKGTPRARARRG